MGKHRCKFKGAGLSDHLSPLSGEETKVTKEEEKNMSQVSNEMIKTIRQLVELEKTAEDLYFEIVEAIALIFPRCLKEQLQQLVNGPIWDGNIISKNHRGILFEMGLAMRVCCKGEQGHTGAKYIAYSILKKMKENQRAKEEASGMRPVPTTEELQKILNSESSEPVTINPSGGIEH